MAEVSVVAGDSGACSVHAINNVLWMLVEAVEYSAESGSFVMFDDAAILV